MFITVKLKSFAKPLAVIGAAALLVMSIFAVFPDEAVSVIGPYNGHTLLIDAGHGGVDGGAVSSDGLKESDVNLAIALRMSGLCELMGIDHQMTRKSDVGCLNSESYSEHDDLVARANMANSISDCVLISVHQNKYPSELVKGAEVMYAATPESRELGLLTQDNMVAVLDQENRRVAHSAPDELLLVPMDATLIEQVLVNLMENAVRHGEHTTTIWLTVERTGDLALFNVTDDGCGIAPEVLPVMFDGTLRHVDQSDSDGKRNMGIGLSVCQSIVKAHGGSIMAQNLPEGGARISFILPMDKEEIK